MRRRNGDIVSEPIVTQLVVDASGSTTGVAEYTAALDKLKKAHADGGGSITAFEAAERKWVSSLAAADPVIRAQINMQQALGRQMAINIEAVKLGITSQDAAAQQIEKVRAKYQGYMDAASGSTKETLKFTDVVGFAREVLGAFGIALSVEAVVGWGKAVFANAAALNNQAATVGLNVEQLQVYRDALKKAGVDVGSADTILQHLTRSLGEAERAPGPARSALIDLGVTAADLAGGPGAVIPKIAAGLSDMKDKMRQAADATALTGRAGQEVIPALGQLRRSYDDLATDAKNAGLVVDQEFADKAQAASIKIEESASRLEVSATPVIVGLTTALTSLLDRLQRISARDWVITIVNTPGAIGRGIADIVTDNLGVNDGPPQINSVGVPALGIGGDPAASPDLAKTIAGAGAPVIKSGSNATGFSSPNSDKYLAGEKLAAELSGLDATHKAMATAEIELANKHLEDGVGFLSDQNGRQALAVSSLSQIPIILTAAEIKQVDGLALTIATAKAHDHIKETLDDYVAKLGEGARLAGLTTTEKEDELNIIKAAQIAETERGVKAKDLTQTYRGAIDALHRYGQDQAATDIRAADATGHVNTLLRQQGEQIEQLNAGLGMTADQRALIAKDMQDELAVGAGITDEQRAQIENNNMIIQQKQRINAVADAVNSPHDQNVRNIGDIRAGVAGGQIGPGRGAEAIAENPLSRGLSDMDQSIGNQLAISPDAKFKDDIKQAKLLETTRTNILDDALKARLVTEEQYNVRRKDIAAAAADDLAKIDQAQQDQRLQAASDFFGSLASLSQSSNATLAAIGKAAAISQATIDGILAVQKALAHYPPPLSYIMAAGAGIAAAANVAKIMGLADGMVSIQRQGGGPSDIIPTMLTPGESVVNVVGTNRNRGALAAMNAGASFDAARNWSPTAAAAPANSNAPPPIIIINTPPGTTAKQTQQPDGKTVIDIIDERVKEGFNQHLDQGLETLARKGSRGVQAISRWSRP